MSHNYTYGSFSRLSDFPLDDRYLFETKELLNKYLIKTGKITTTAYEGQLVYVIEDESLYLIQKKDNGDLYPQIITSERYDDADIRDEINNIKTALNNGKYHHIEENGGIAFGIYTVARDYRFAVGEYNIDDKDALFIVGNGTEAERNNAFTVNKDGTATVSSDPKKDTDVATKKYVDEKVSNVDVDLTDYATKDDLNNAVDGLVDTETLNNTVKDLATKDELQSAIDNISVVSKEEFKELSEKVENLDTDIDGLVEDLNVQNDAIVSLSDRVNNIENATPEIPENVVDEDRLTEVLENYTTTDDLTDAISKISTLNKKIIEGVSGDKVVIDGAEREPDSSTIYLLKDNSSTGPDIYKEYTLIDGELTLIGDTSTSLTGLATTEYVDSKVNSIDIPVNVSDLVNDTGYITDSYLEDYVRSDELPTKVSQLENDKNYINDLSNYYTKEEVDALIAEDNNGSGDVTIPIQPTIRLDDAVSETSSNGVKSSGIYSFVKDEISKIEHPDIEVPSLDGYATEEWVIEQGYLTEHQSLENYATKTFVSEKIAEAQLADKEIDLSAYATKEDIKDLATESFVNNAISSIEIPDTSSFITMADVEEKGYITEHQSLEGYATEEWVGEQGYLTELPEHTHDQYLTEHQDISGKLDVSVYNTEKETFLTEDDISNVATKDDLTPITNNIDGISKKVDSQQEVINKFFTGNAQEAYDELSEIGAAIVELRDQVIDENIAGALVDKVIDIEKTRYTKTEVDNLLEDKANKEHSHEEYTTETKVNTLIDAKLGQVSIDSIDPSKVVFPEEVKTTYSIGKITVSNNTPTTLIKAGGTLKDFFNIFIDETIGTVTQPSIPSLSMSGNDTYYEVGYTLSKPKLSFTFNDGNYKYGPEPTGVKLTSIAVTYNGVNKTLSDFTVSGNNYSVTFDDVVISKEGDICNLTNLDIGYSAGSKPITNLGNESDTGAISAGTLANKHSGISSCKGYWPLFYINVTETKNDDGTFDRLIITADNIRSKLTKSDLKSKTAFSIAIGDGSTSVIIAVPSSWGEIKSIKDVQANADVLSGFSVSDLKINGYNENTKYKQTYKLYVFNSAGLGSTTYNVSF